MIYLKFFRTVKENSFFQIFFLQHSSGALFLSFAYFGHSLGIIDDGFLCFFPTFLLSSGFFWVIIFDNCIENHSSITATEKKPEFFLYSLEFFALLKGIFHVMYISHLKSWYIWDAWGISGNLQCNASYTLETFTTANFVLASIRILIAPLL